MQVNRILGVSSPSKINAEKTKKSQSNQRNVSFKNFASAVKASYSLDVRNTVELTAQFKYLFRELMKEKKLCVTAFMEDLLKNYDFARTDVKYILRDMCKPNKQISCRSLAYYIDCSSPHDEAILISKKWGDHYEGMYLKYRGKYGFFNNLFESEADPNDIRLIFRADKYAFQVGLQENGNLQLKQRWSDDRQYSKFDSYSRISKSTRSSICIDPCAP